MPCDSCNARSEPADYAVVSKGLCAVLTVLEAQGKLSSVLNAADWEEAGVTRYDVAEWWTLHKKKDKARREREESEQYRLKLAMEAYNKLTPAQRDALGVRAPR